MARMVTLLARPPKLGGPGAEAPLLRQWWAGTIAGTWAAATLVLPLCVLGFIGWITDHGSTSIAGALRLGADLWLAGNGAPIDTTGGSITLHPLGVTLVIALLLWRAGMWAGASSHLPTGWSTARLVGSIAVVYAGLVAAVTVLGATPGIRPDLVRGVAGAAVLSLLAAGAGVVRGAGRSRSLYRRMPTGVRVALEAGTGATLMLLAGGALLLAASLTMHFGQVLTLTDALGPGPVGGFLLLVVCMSLVPSAAIYALSYAVGPGFALGTGSSVSIAGSHVGALPALPLLGAVPSGASSPAYAYAVLAVPIVAGLVAGILAIVRGSGVRAEVAALRALGAGPVAGLAVLAMTWAAGGGVGTGRLSALGPSPVLVALVTTAEVGVLAAVTAWVGYPRGAVVAAVVKEPRGTATIVPLRAVRPAPAVPSTPAEPATQQPVTPKLVTPKLVTPKRETPKLETPKLVAPERAAPKPARPKPAGPPGRTMKVRSGAEADAASSQTTDINASIANLVRETSTAEGDADDEGDSDLTVSIAR